MQRKTIAYIFGIASFAGLIVGAVFFANELRLKINEDPDKNQFESGLDQSFLAPLGEALNKKSQNQKSSASQATNTSEALSDSPVQTAEPPEVENIVGENQLDKDEDSFSFAVLGDTHKFDAGESDGGLQQAIKAVQKEDIKSVLALGDLFSDCDGDSKCEEKLSDWRDALGGLYEKTYAVMGEEDRTGKDKSDSLWKEFFDFPKNGPDDYKELAFSFDLENSHFVVLDSEKPEKHKINETQRDWLEKDLSENEKTNTFVFFHEPAYPLSGEIGSSLDASESERDELWKILKDHKVIAVFSGHEHITSRKKIDGIYQYVFGNTDSESQNLPASDAAEYSYDGKSYGIVKVKGKQVTVNVYSVNGNLLDSFEISN